ncbi:hypothetical protein IAR55_006401 [Kwoniella newhampshirensis]|uniref:C2H2-type domain-containing protein n=1 Tax=Kwoniella newhampshirensis TaxID=1651941 RepID=A0AAW0YU49_9TREE
MADPSSFDQAGGPSATGIYPPPARPRSPPPRLDRDHEDRSGFTRGGFAPIPHRHSDLPPLPPPARYEREDHDRGRGMRDREFPRRDLDPEPEERWERREWDDYDRRPRVGPPSHWEDDYDRPKRRRSPSPLGPPSHRPRIHSPSPPPRHGHMSLPDPASIETLLSFRNFAEWFRSSHPQTARMDEEETRKFREMIESGTATEAQAKEKVGMAKRYERYRKEFTSRQLYALFLTHRDSAWFKERYSDATEYADLRHRLNRQGRVPAAEKYMEELRAGAWDTVDFDMTESDEKSSSKTRRMSDHEEPEGLDRALGDKADWGLDESFRLEIAPKSRQVFVKTAPPTTNRKDLEELFARMPGFQWLALSEPSQKKSFHRVAWAQYADDVDISEVIQKLDGQKIDGFTFHMSINSSPTIGRLKVTPPVANTLERLLQDGENAKALALKLEEELLGDEDEQNEETPAVEGESLNEASTEKKVRGLKERPSDAVQATVTRLLQAQGFNGEDLTTEDHVRKAKAVLDQWIAYLRHGLSTCYYCVAPTSFPEELHRKCIGHMRSRPSDKSHVDLEPINETNGKDEVPGHKAGGESDERKIAVGGEDLREERESRDQDDRSDDRSRLVPTEKKALVFPQKTQDEKWVESLDLKIKPLIGEVDVADYGGRDPEVETKKLCAPLIKQEEPSKYRCKDCNKLFRAPEFVIKHIAVKHPEVTKSKLDEISLLNNFVLDPQHLQPGASTLAAVNDKLVSSQSFGGPAPMLMAAINPAMMPSSFDSSAPTLGQGSGGAGFNLMQQQMMMMMQMQQAMMMGQMPMALPVGGSGTAGGGQGGSLGSRIGGFAGPSGGGRDASMSATPMATSLPLPPAPPGGEDPRARRGRVSYQDLDEPGGGGGGGLPY